MRLHVVHVFTHDSIALGEDGPTHQPVEQLAGLRSVPELLVIRPADANETAVAWRVALEAKDRPVAFALSRQKVPTLDRARYASADGLRKGAYVLLDADGGQPDVIVIGTGAETGLALAAVAKLQGEGIAARAVSIPCWELFRSEEHTSELQSLMRLSYAVLCLKKKNQIEVLKPTQDKYKTQEGKHTSKDQDRNINS